MTAGGDEASATDLALMALADGELSDAEAERLRAAMAADPSLARRYELYAASRRVLRQAFAQLDELPASPRLLASLRREQAATLAPRVAPRRAVFALAAGLLLTVGLAAWFGQQAQRSHDASVGTQLARESGAVAAALEHLAAGEEARIGDGAQALSLMPLASYDGGTAWCREFEARRVSGDDALRALACRDAAAPAWEIREVIASTAAPEDSGSEFRPASGERPAVLQGRPLTPEQERAAIASGWPRH